MSGTGPQPGALDAAPADDPRGLLAEWNATGVDYPADACLHRLFEAQVERTPDAVALVFEDRELRYAELNARANQLARTLRRIGVGPEVLVGVCMERSLELVIALYAILKAGGAYVPLDPELPPERLAFMLSDTLVPVVLTQERLEERLPADDVHLLCLDRDWERVADPETGDLEEGAGAGNLAYVIYTSGSTGRPKGVMNEHRGICNRLFWMQDTFALGAGDVVLQKTPCGFDVSVWEFFWPLLFGARLVLARPDGHRDPGYLRETIAGHGVTTLHFVPSMLQVFLEEPGLEQLRSLRRVICSGEALPPDLMQRFFARVPGELHNLYGPTEAAVDVTHWPCRPGGRDGVVPIGRPVANTSIHILDEALRPVPPGGAGELHIGGVQVARGYLNRPELTAQKFIPDPFSDDPRARLYRTGDLARFLPDGNVEYLGRLDFQVKIRGVRIELGEIEAALLAHPAIREAVVTAREDASGLIAYWVPHRGAQAPSLSELRSFLLRSLPDAMLPAAFVLLEEMPLSANGKVERRALPAPEPARPALADAYRTPTTPLESFLAEAWQEVLGIDRIGVDDDYFELGGDSIQAAIVVSRIQEALDAFVYVVALFEAPTIARLATYLATHYPEATRRAFGPASLEGARGAGPGGAAAVGPGEIERFRRLVAGAGPGLRQPAPAQRNPRAIFVLAPPRSGSTLLRVMLAGHSGLFAPQELELLAFDTLREMRETLSGKYAFWIEGTLRTLMELEGCGPDEARAFLEARAARGDSTLELYRRLQERCGGRVLVDKTPSYCLHPEVLRRMERDFESPLYVHLLRHPCAMVDSFEKVSLDQVFFREPHDFGTAQLAELIWQASHANILDFLEGVPAERRLRLRFEDLVREPRESMLRICALAGLELEEEMLHPYRNVERKMTDGLHAVSIMRGDPKFHRHAGIDPGAAEGWRQAGREDRLGAATWRVAEALGYPRPADPPPPSEGTAAVPIQPAGSRPPFFFASGVQNHFGPRLGPDQPVYRLQIQNLGADEPFVRAEEMAAWCIEGVKAIQPEGPYYLGGHCFGGVVAFEMAQQLRARGEEVALLALCESFAAATRGQLVGSRGSRIRKRLSYHLGQARRIGVLGELRHLGRGVRRLLREWFWRTTEQYRDPRAANYRAQHRYAPRCYPGGAVLFQCTERGQWRRGLPEDGWGPLLAEGLEVHRIPGSHTGMYREPHVGVLVEKLGACLRAAQERARG